MDDKIKRLRIAAICCFLGAFGFYASVVLTGLTGGHYNVMYALLGSAFLCMGGANLNRANKLDAENKAEEEDEKE